MIILIEYNWGTTLLQPRLNPTSPAVLHPARERSGIEIIVGSLHGAARAFCGRRLFFVRTCPEEEGLVRDTEEAGGGAGSLILATVRV